MLQAIYSIEEAHKIYDTGSTPLLVTCNDLRDWVCKYERNGANLFNEVLAAQFASKWGIPTPEIALVNIKPEHVPAKKFPQFNRSAFDKPWFGSLYLTGVIEINQTMSSLFKDPHFKRKIENITDLLKIALFDIWLANEDRNHNNQNMLLKLPLNKRPCIYAIDHVNIFNSSHLNYGITELTEDETIINTSLAKILFANRRDIHVVVNDLIEKFYLCINECSDNLDEFIGQIPDSWITDKTAAADRIKEYLFDEKWTRRCEQKFREFIQRFIIN